MLLLLKTDEQVQEHYWAADPFLVSQYSEATVTADPLLVPWHRETI